MAGQHATTDAEQTPAKGGAAETKHYLVARIVVEIETADAYHAGLFFTRPMHH